MNTLLILIAMLGFSIVLDRQTPQLEKTIQKNGMSVSWSYIDDRIFFELQAPTSGWLTVGFNETNDLTGAYLIMTRVYSTIPEVVEHHVISHGNYKPIENIDIDQIADVEGKEFQNHCVIKFSLKVENLSPLRKNLTKGKYIFMTLAYSRSDDFQHHSIMRTNVQVQL